jgi:hypothetical protein
LFLQINTCQQKPLFIADDDQENQFLVLQYFGWQSRTTQNIAEPKIMKI